MRDAVILFAKAPRMGHVKTRLIARLGKAAATALHEAFVQDMAESLRVLNADLIIATDEEGAWHGLGLPVILQRGKDLGERIRIAAEEALREGRPVCAIAGSDAPTLPSTHVETLLGMQADVSVGPADDGGFYAIACRRVEDGMFDQVRWSEATTFKETQAALTRAKLSCATGPVWFDVDTPEDLDRLRRGDLPRHTRNWMERHLAQH